MSKNLGWPGSFPGPGFGQPQHQYDYITGHAIFDEGLFRQYLRPNPFFITTLREPGAQGLSAFNYFGPTYLDQSVRTWPQYLDWLASQQNLSSHGMEFLHAREFFVNPQAADLGWYRWLNTDRTVHDKDNSTVHRWLHSLGEPLEVNGLVLLLEYIDEGLVLLKHRLQLDLHELMSIRINTGAYSLQEPTEEAKAQVRPLLPVDMELYAHFNRSFHMAWAEATASSTEVEADLAELRRLNAELAVNCSSFPEGLESCNTELRMSEWSWSLYDLSKEPLGCTPNMTALSPAVGGLLAS